jgi:hypothetical protein
MSVDEVDGFKGLDRFMASDWRIYEVGKVYTIPDDKELEVDDRALSFHILPSDVLESHRFYNDNRYVLVKARRGVLTAGKISYARELEIVKLVSEDEMWDLCATMRKTDAIEVWSVNGTEHRGGDLPAKIAADGSKGWFKRGLLHRDNGPAIEYSDGTKLWYNIGCLHRDKGLPAIEYANGAKEWWVNGQRHRDGDLPAEISPDGWKRWWRHDIMYKHQQPEDEIYENDNNNTRHLQ